MSFLFGLAVGALASCAAMVMWAFHGFPRDR